MTDAEQAELMQRLDVAIAILLTMEDRIRLVIEGNRAQLSTLYDSLHLREMRQELRDIRMGLTGKGP